MEILSYLGFLPVLLIVLVVVIFTKISNLKDRVADLEKKIGLKKTETNDLPVQTYNMLNTTSAPVESPLKLNIPDQESPDSIPVGDKFVNWLKEDWLLKLGGFLLLIGFGWLTTYAFMNNWIGPVGRITFGILAGVIILCLGTWRIKSYINQGGIFLVLGSTVILLTVFAGRGMYQMFTPASALIIMFLSTAYVSMISVKYDAFAVALSGLVLSAVAPLLTGVSVNDFSLFSYLLAVILGVVWIVSIKKNWGNLVFSSLIVTALYCLPYLVDSFKYKSENYLLIFAYVFAGIFFLTSVISILKSNGTDIKSFLLVAVCNGAFVLAWIMSFVSPEWQSFSILAWMIVFVIGAFILFKATNIKECFYVYAGLAIVMLGTATAIELSGVALTIAYILEAGLVPVLIYTTTSDFEATSSSSFLLLIPGCLSFGSLANYFNSKEVFTKDFFVVFLMVAVLLFVGIAMKKIILSLGKNSDLGNGFVIVGSLYAYIVLWAMLHIGIEDSATATTFSLIIFTIIGLIKYFYGISAGSKVLRNYGAFFLGFVVIRLITIDIWQMDMGARIIIFFLIGLLLISTAFIGKKIKSGFVEQVNN